MGAFACGDTAGVSLRPPRAIYDRSRLPDAFSRSHSSEDPFSRDHRRYPRAVKHKMGNNPRDGGPGKALPHSTHGTIMAIGTLRVNPPLDPVRVT